MSDLAAAVVTAIPSTVVEINQDALLDRRSYRVDFSLFKKLAPDYVPRMDLAAAISDLEMGLQEMDFEESDFRKSAWIRLNVLAKHVERGVLTPDLRWQDKSRVA